MGYSTHLCWAPMCVDTNSENTFLNLTHCFLPNTKLLMHRIRLEFAFISHNYHIMLIGCIVLKAPVKSTNKNLQEVFGLSRCWCMLCSRVRVASSTHFPSAYANCSSLQLFTCGTRWLNSSFFQCFHNYWCERHTSQVIFTLAHRLF